MSGPSGHRARLPRTTGTRARDRPDKTQSKPTRTDAAAAQAAYGNGVVSTIVFDDPLVVTAKPPPPTKPAKPLPTVTTISGGKSTTTVFKPSVPPPVAAATTDGDVIEFAPDVVYGKAPPPTVPKPAPPPASHVADQTIVFAPDTIQAKPPGAATPTPATPAAKVNPDGSIEFAPDVIQGNAPGVTQSAGAGKPASDQGLPALGPDGTPLPAPAAADAAADKDIKPKGAADTKAAPGAEDVEEEADGEEKKPKDVASAEKVAEDGLPKPAAVAAQAAGPEAAGGGGDSGAGQDIAAWRSRVSAATAATPKPTLGNTPAASVTVIHGAGQGATAKRKVAGGALVDDAKKAVRKPPDTPKQLPPPPPTPVPAADQLITDASDKKLPDQPLPQLKRRSADSTEPEMDADLAADMGSTIDVPAPEPAAEAAPGDKKALDAKQVKKLKDAKAKEPDPGKKAKSNQPMTLKDTAPPPTPGMEVGTGRQSKERVAQVLAELLRSPDTDAEGIVAEVRKEAYPRQALHRVYPTFGIDAETDKKSEIVAELKAQVESIRSVAQISSKELDEAIKTRNEELKKLEGDSAKTINEATARAKEETQAGGVAMADKIAGAREAVDENTIQKMIAANGEADPEVIKLRRDKGLRDLTRRAARQDVYYEKAGERRLRALDAAHPRMRDAYKNAAKADKTKIYDQVFADAKAANKADDVAKAEATTQSETQAKPFFEWAATQTLELNRQFSELRSTASSTIKGFRDGIKTALDQAKTLVRDWAEKKIGEQETWWDSLIRMFREWVQDATDDSAAWEEARSESLRNSLVGDLNMIDDLTAAATSGVDMQAYVQKLNMDQAQATVLQTYFAGDTGKPRDAIGAVAAGMRMRIRVARKPGIIASFKSKLMSMPDKEWPNLEIIANVERSPFSASSLASDLFQAMDQWGTEEEKIYPALANLTPLQAKTLRSCYLLTYGRSLDEHLKSEMEGSELTRAQALLEGNQTLADVAALHEAMHGGLTGLGTDENTIMQVLRGKSAEERAAIVAEYKKQYGIDLNKDLKDELNDGWSSSHDFERARALMAGNTEKADAIAIDQAMHGGVFGAGTEEQDITAVYEQNRTEVEAEAARKGWTKAQIEAEIKRRNDKIEEQYEKRYGDPSKPKRPGDKSALRKAFEDEMSDAELDLAVALADNDPLKADAARLGVEKQSFITSDETVNKILASQYQRARKDVEREVNMDLQFRAEVDSLQDKPWTPERWQQEQKDAKTKIDEESKARGKLNMSALENAYDDKYSKFGKGGLQCLIIFNMSGDDQRKAFDLVKQGGYLEPEQEIFYAVNGIGTDVDALKRVLKDKSPEEIAKIKKAWKDRYKDEPDLETRILDEVGGRDTQDMKWALEGEPQTLDGKLKRAQERMHYENTSYWLGDSFSKREKAIMQDRYNALEAETARLKRMEYLKADRHQGESDQDYEARLEEYAFWDDAYKLKSGNFDRAVEDHRTAVDSLADTAATVAAIVATVVVMIAAVVVTVLTGGAAAPGIGAAIGAALASAKVAAAAALAAAAATIATKQALKGSAYSGQDMAIDAIVGVVDAAASYMTAGLGGALLKTAKGAPASRLAGIAARSKVATKLAEMAASNRMVTRVFANGLAEGIEGVAQALPSALIGSVADEKNWSKGNPLANIMGGTLMATGMAAGLSFGLGGLGGIGKHADDVADALPTGRKALAESIAESGDVLGKRGVPMDRVPLWKAWSAENPGKPYKDFLQEFDAGLITKEADDAARDALQREMRTELMDAIPAAQRGQFADVPIEIMSDADFQKFTRSAKGQAVVIFEDGKPRVILREGADPSALREEGIHLLQSKDPKFAKKIAELDEARLVNWKELDLDEQLRLYQTKLEIELDAQQRLLKNLDDQLAEIDDPALRKSLEARRAAAAKNFENLQNRMDEVTNLSPAERLKIANKEIDPPQYLDQKPRLFAKDAGDVDVHPEVAKARARHEAVQQPKAAFVKFLQGLGETAVPGQVKRIIENFEVIWTIAGNRTRAFISAFAKDMKKGASKLYDLTVSRMAFLELARSLLDAKQLDKLDSMMAGARRLFEAKVSAKVIDAFARLTPLLENPGKMFALVDDLVSLKSFRQHKLPEVAGLLEKIAKSSADEGPHLADQFNDELKKLAGMTAARDAIDKKAARVAWDQAQKELDDAADELKKKIGAGHYPGISELEAAGVLEEFSRSGRFHFPTFAEGLTERYATDKTLFGELQKMVEEIRKLHPNEWIDNDVGPIMHWGSLLEKVHGKLKKEGQASLMDRIKEQLGKLLPNLGEGGYKAYRTSVKNEVIEQIMKAETPAAQYDMLQSILELVKDKDNASLGEYFAAFRRKIFEKGQTHAIQGELAGAYDLGKVSRELQGGLGDVDGALHLPEGGLKADHAPKEGGTFFVEDKEGFSFKASQAKNYDTALKTGQLKTIDGTPAKGIIYFVEDPVNATDIAAHLAAKDYHPNIFVTTFGGDGKEIVFVPRPSGPKKNK